MLMLFLQLSNGITFIVVVIFVCFSSKFVYCSFRCYLSLFSGVKIIVIPCC